MCVYLGSHTSGFVEKGPASSFSFLYTKPHVRGVSSFSTRFFYLSYARLSCPFSSAALFLWCSRKGSCVEAAAAERKRSEMSNNNNNRRSEKPSKCLPFGNSLYESSCRYHFFSASSPHLLYGSPFSLSFESDGCIDNNKNQ